MWIYRTSHAVDSSLPNATWCQFFGEEESWQINRPDIWVACCCSVSNQKQIQCSRSDWCPVRILNTNSQILNWTRWLIVCFPSFFCCWHSAFWLLDSTWLGAVDERHPQLLLKGLPTPYLMEHGQKTPFPGFLGFAVNLLHLSEEQLAMKVAVNNRAAPNRLFGLRESLFYHLLRELQVYKSREDMNAAKAKGFVKSGAISLDGYIIKPNMLQQLGESSSWVFYPKLILNQKIFLPSLLKHKLGAANIGPGYCWTHIDNQR